MTLRQLSVPFIALVLAACGGNAPPAESPGGGHGHGHGHGEGQEHGEGHEHGKGHEHGEGHGHEPGHEEKHAKLPPPLKEFHGVLAPVWHTEKGPKRVEKACADVKALQEKAEGTKDAELIAGTKALADECAKDGKPEVEAKLHAVHERFHALAK